MGFESKWNVKRGLFLIIGFMALGTYSLADFAYGLAKNGIPQWFALAEGSAFLSCGFAFIRLRKRERAE